MLGNVWPDQIETSLEDANVFPAKTQADVSHFCPLSLGFENRISPIFWLPLCFHERDLLRKYLTELYLLLIVC